MAPKKKSSTPKKAPRRTSKYRNTGILGLPHTEYHSSEDEDFVPPKRTPAKASQAPASKPSRRPKRPAVSEPSNVAMAVHANQEDDSSSESGESLLQRLQRRNSRAAHVAGTAAAAATWAAAAGTGSAAAGGTTAAARGGRGSKSSRASRLPLTGTANWAHLPPDVLAQVFEVACRRQAVPVAARLPCVCRGWRDVAVELPQLWAHVELGVLPAVKPKRVAAVEAGLVHMASSGRWCQLAHLQVGGSGLEGSGSTSGGSSGGSSSSTPDHGRLLAAVAQHCSSTLVSLHIDSIRDWKAEALEPQLLALTSLQELRLSAVTLKPITGLDRMLKALMAAVTAAETGVAPGPKLRLLAVTRCHALNRAGVKALCPSPVDQAPPDSPPPAAAAAAVAAAGGAAAGPPAAGAAGGAAAGLPVAAGAQEAAALPAGLLPTPALGSLRVLDLSFSAQTLVQLHIEQLQEAAPCLEELRLAGLGSGYGWSAVSATRRAAAPAPAFPRLRVLDVAAPIITTGMVQHGAYSYVDNTLLARLAGGSPLLQELDISGTNVTRAGLALLPSPPISRLQVSRCSDVASDEGLGEVARLLGATLSELEAQSAGSRIGDAALHSLGQCHRLQLLDLSGSGVTKAGLQALLKSLAGASLQLLELESCRGLDREMRRAAAAGLQQLRDLVLGTGR